MPDYRSSSSTADRCNGGARPIGAQNLQLTTSFEFFLKRMRPLQIGLIGPTG